MTSLLAKSVLRTLKEAFPNTRINAEYYVNYQGQRLFFDFHLPNLNIVVEVQGVQHTEFTPHFHGTAEAFKAQKKRDRSKLEWCDIEDMALVCINHNEIPIGVPNLLQKIEESQRGPENQR
jgi:very-short-patch-repair endonuclease